MLHRLDALPEPQRVALSVAFGLSVGDAPDRFLVALAALSLLSDVAEKRPLLCCVDDAQWLDSASAQVLGFVARRLLAESVAIVFAVREPSRGTPSWPACRSCRSAGWTTRMRGRLLASVIPGRLDERVRERIVAETRGNPLALLELPRGMSAAELAGGFALPDAVGLPGRIQDHYLRRVGALPEPTTQDCCCWRRPTRWGTPTLLWRAAQTLGIDRGAADVGDSRAAAGDRRAGAVPPSPGPIGGLQRSALRPIGRSCTAPSRPPPMPAPIPTVARGIGRTRSSAPDEAVADELIALCGRCAAPRRHRGRGGVPGTRGGVHPGPRRAGVAGARWPRGRSSRPGTSRPRSRCSPAPKPDPLDELGQAQAQRMRAQIAFDMRRGRDAPRLLLRAAQRLEPLDAELARETHLEALVAAIYASCFAAGTDVTDVAVAARAAPLDPEPMPASQLLLLGLATRLTDGCAAAAPTLSKALRAYRGEEQATGPTVPGVQHCGGRVVG